MAAPTTTTLGLPLGTRPAGTPVTPPLTGTIRIYAVGDSLTVGTPSVNSWRQYVAEMLAAAGVTWTPVGHMASSAPDWALYNAVFGRDLQTSIDQFTTNPTMISDANPHVVCLLPYGNNDMTDDTALAAAPGKMTTLLEQFRAAAPSARVVVSYLYGHGNDAAKDARHDSFNVSLDTVWADQVTAGQSITICDPRPFINVPKNSGMRSDYTHPTEPGYRRLADCYFAGICNAIGINAQWGRPTS